MTTLSISDIKLVLAYAEDKSINLPEYLKTLKADAVTELNKHKFDYPVYFGNEPTDGCMTDYYCSVRADWVWDEYTAVARQIIPDSGKIYDLVAEYCDIKNYTYNYGQGETLAVLVDIIDGNDGGTEYGDIVDDMCEALIDESDDAYWVYWEDEDDDDDDLEDPEDGNSYED